jgi:SagB-type dehydrogenase family enzyme
LEFLLPIEAMETRIADALAGQAWAASANVVFFWSVIPYRSEWRYSHFAHRIILVDAGHIAQNLYIACEALHLGTCAVGAFDRIPCDAMFGLDGEDEFTILASPVGTVPALKEAPVPTFYAFEKHE